MSVLVDSDILIEVSRGCNQEVLARWDELANSDRRALYSPVTSAELWGGARPQEQRALEALFRALLCVPIDDEIGHRAGAYLRLYRKSHNLEVADALIAASAAVSKAALWSRNRKHFPMKELSFY